MDTHQLKILEPVVAAAEVFLKNFYNAKKKLAGVDRRASLKGLSATQKIELVTKRQQRLNRSTAK